ncbi:MULTISPECIES: RluA family pseudouridine synthase [unclassified Sphingobium]|uniref:RluA family pseudouridine synthase n=1 Tax=unclassified Sphingobium TaxID=2611147 RepID=UPI002225579D|nr:MULTISPECIES: RluA family pseudouridine synthase [unclassified Sphingobium]MCW2383170.1 23S rRNA pseudouridine1911/1915/1917 synthase [Sphingobium sp. B2D3B]MCW2399854.1 23S rRNA pseudouridine1911/1915/1917 synthase [Sphingobium sp. B2D3C]
METGVTSITALITQAEHGMRLDRALASVLPALSRERVKALILAGQVTGPDGRPAADPAYKVKADMAFAVEIPAATPAEAQPQAIDLVIAHEDAHLIVVDKPAGMVVHPAAGNPDGTLVNALLHHCAGQLSGIGGVARPGIVHRIDKDTSGLLVVAKTDQAHEGLARQFKDHSIDRRYLAIVQGRPAPPSGKVDQWIGRSDADRKKMAVQREGRGKHAITHYRTLERLDRAALIECRLETGRTHQVRVHMAHLGHPLLGDPVYARGGVHKALLAELGFHRQALHAARLGFIHPVTSQPLSFESPITDDMQQLFSHLCV